MGGCVKQNRQMWVDVLKWVIFGDHLSLDVDKLVLLENDWNKEIEDFMLSATRKHNTTLYNKHNTKFCIQV